MRKIESPCYNCKDRKIGCHSLCKAYKKWRDERKKKVEVAEYIREKQYGRLK